MPMRTDPTRTPLPRRLFRRSERTRGQSLVEFALILPLMLTLFGASVDFARLYKGWIDLQASTRAAAEYVAATYDLQGRTPQAVAQSMVCTQVTGNSSCTSPTVTATLTTSATMPGATSDNPIGIATVTASMPFRTLFSYPLLTQNGVWMLGASATFTVVQGR